MALQDAHAAMRFMVDHAKYYNIDTSNIFVGGASAGSITALNLAFMTDNDRPQAVKGNRFRDMGTIASSGNSSHATFRIKALANMILLSCLSEPLQTKKTSNNKSTIHAIFASVYRKILTLMILFYHIFRTIQ